MKKMLSVVLVLVFIATTLLQARVSAISNYNNLIDDAMFDNVNSMNSGQIDAFLNTFPGSCISTNNGFSAPLPTGYTHTGKYTYGGLVSAGTVLATVAQAYSINPQVLLATLQKEQGLVKGDGGNVVKTGTDCGALAISASVGYNCPDSLALTSYSGFTIYGHNGTPVTSVTNTCVRNAAYVGFSQQLTISAWQFSFDRHRSEGLNNWYANKGGWDNSDDLGFCYSGRMVQGGPYLLCPDQDSPPPALKYDGLYTIDGTTVHVDNGATAALYNYTPHLHGQALFVDTFNGWFGSTYLGCGVGETTLPQVLSYYNPKTYDHFYTSYQCEANVLTASLGYRLDGAEFNTTNPTSVPTALPVYRLYNPNTTQHLWTTDWSDVDNAMRNAGFHFEGVAFYSAPIGAPGASIVWRLYNPKTYQHVWTGSQNSILFMTQQLGFKVEGIAFYTQ
jgi:hypothetical protein